MKRDTYILMLLLLLLMVGAVVLLFVNPAKGVQYEVLGKSVMPASMLK